jgi:cytochrome c-type biogenesis protein CcmF
VLGVAVSGPFQKTHEVPLSPGENFSFGGYLFEYTKLRTEKKPELAIEEAVITVSKDGKRLGELTPQRRLYRNYDHPNSEVSTLFSLGDELYATIHDIEGERVQPLKVSINPMVNWVWIGSLGITFLPLLAWRTRRAQGDHSDE